MSRTIGNYKLLKVISKRGYAAQAAVKPTHSSDISVVDSSKNIRLIAAYPNYPLSKVSFTYRAGARYEVPENLGITHILRQAVVLTTQDYTSFSLHRVSSQYGFNLYASVDREAFTYTVEAHPSKIDLAVNFLVNVATKQTFKPWELGDNVNKIKLDLLSVPAQAKTLDLLHKAAYRNGLGNSLFVDPSRIDKINYEQLFLYVNEHFTAPRAQVTSTSLTPSELEQILPIIEADSTAGPATVKSTYCGGEIRVPNYKENITYVAVAGDAPGFTQKEYLPYALLQFVYADVAPIKYGSGQSILNKALNQQGIVGAVTGINASYSDSSLVGFFFAANNSDVVQGYDAVLNAFLKADITDRDVAKAKAKYKSGLLIDAEGTGIVDLLSKQIAANSIISPFQAAAAIDSVTTADVKQAAKKLLAGKLSVASYGGDVHSLPYIDTIKK